MSGEGSPLKGLLSGGFGGLCGLLVGHPLDTVKVRLQTMPVPSAGQTPLYTGMLDCIRQTLRREGPLGLYRGMGAPFLCVVPTFASCFYGYNVGVRLIHGSEAQKNSPLTKLEVLCAGMFAGVFTTVVMTPTERIKCFLQAQMGANALRGPLDALHHIYREGGLTSICRGATATLLREIPSSGAFFLSNALLREKMRKLNRNEPLSNWQILTAGGLAGMANWAVALPMDMLKSRLQAAPEGRYPLGIRSVFKEMVATESVMALYRGAVPVMVRTFPTAGSCFLGYEWCMRFLDKMW